MTHLLDKRLILVVGKGGVGRSTVAAALGAACARRGRRTLLYEFNANDRFGDLFGLGRPVERNIVRLRDNLHAVNPTPADALEEYGLMVLRFKRVYRMVFENRVTKYFLRAIPGLDDYAILGKAWYQTTETSRGRNAWDTVIFDMAASGHSLSMLRIPWVIVDTVPEGPLTRDARTIVSLLSDPNRTGLVMTTLAEEMPTNEARELAGNLENDLGLSVDQLVVNQVYPDNIPVDSPVEAILERLHQARDLAPDLVELRDHAELGRQRRRLNETYIDELSRALPVARAELPLLFEPRLGPTELEKLTARLEEQLGAG